MTSATIRKRKNWPDFDLSSVRGLLFESAQKLREIRPLTLGQAGRIPGVTPADIQLLAVHIERFRKLKNAQKTAH